jgi:transmembrane sensor
MTDDPSYIADLLVKHLIGNLNKEEQQLFAHWLAADQRHPQLVKTLLDKDRLKKRFEEYRAIDSRGSWEAIRARLPDLNLPEYEYEPPPVSRIPSFFLSRAALWLTLVGLGIVVAALIWRGGKKKNANANVVAAPSAFGVTLQYNKTQPIDLGACKKGWQLEVDNLLFSKPDSGLVQISILDEKAPIGQVSLTTPKGISYRLRLPDGSTVDLNTDSRIEMIALSNRQDRRVALQGEAYFEINHRDSYLFRVEVQPAVTINVIGTVFDVKAYPHDRTIQAKLVSGKLAVCDPKGQPHLLESGQTLVLDRNGQVKAPVSDTTHEIPWVKDTFNYNGTPIREILDDLSHWYRVDIEVEGEPKGRFTFSCSRKESLQFILDRLEATKHLHYKSFENKVVVYFDQP